MTMEEARVVVLQRAVALLVASIDKNRLHAVAQLLASPADTQPVKDAAAEMAGMIDAARVPNLPTSGIKWPRRRA